jgi:hypothetical protein
MSKVVSSQLSPINALKRRTENLGSFLHFLEIDLYCLPQALTSTVLLFGERFCLLPDWPLEGIGLEWLLS